MTDDTNDKSQKWQQSKWKCSKANVKIACGTDRWQIQILKWQVSEITRIAVINAKKRCQIDRCQKI